MSVVAVVARYSGKIPVQVCNNFEVEVFLTDRRLFTPFSRSVWVFKCYRRLLTEKNMSPSIHSKPKSFSVAVLGRAITFMTSKSIQ